MQDILDHRGKFLTWNVFHRKYNIKCNFLNYFQVLYAIPKYLLEKSRTYSHINKRDLLHSTVYQFSLSVSIDFVKMRCKDYYWLLVNASKVVPSGLKKWQKDLNLGEFNWKSAFTRISKTCKESKLREFNYKFLHRIIVTKKKN